MVRVSLRAKSSAAEFFCAPRSLLLFVSPTTYFLPAVSRPGLDDPLRALRPGRSGERAEGEVRAPSRDQPDLPQREGGRRGRARHEPVGVRRGRFRTVVRERLFVSTIPPPPAPLEPDSSHDVCCEQASNSIQQLPYIPTSRFCLFTGRAHTVVVEVSTKILVFQNLEVVFFFLSRNHYSSCGFLFRVGQASYNTNPADRDRRGSWMSTCNRRLSTNRPASHTNTRHATRRVTYVKIGSQLS